MLRVHRYTPHLHFLVFLSLKALRVKKPPAVCDASTTSSFGRRVHMFSACRYLKRRPLSQRSLGARLLLYLISCLTSSTAAPTLPTLYLNLFRQYPRAEELPAIR